MQQPICDKLAESLMQGAGISESERDHAVNCEACLERVLNSCLADPPTVTIREKFAGVTARRMLSESEGTRNRRLRALSFGVPCAAGFVAWLVLWRGMLPALASGIQPGSPTIIFSVAASLEMTAILLWVTRATRV